jgi:HK97 family phage major capsid protein
MLTLSELHRQLKHQYGQITSKMSLLVRQDADEDKPDDDTMATAFAALAAELEDVKARISRCELAMAAEAAVALANNDDEKPEDGQAALSPGRINPKGNGGFRLDGSGGNPAQVKRDPWRGIKERRGVRAARYVLTVLHAQKTKIPFDEALDQLNEKRFHDDEFVRTIRSPEHIEKALNYSTTGEGGALIPQDFMADLIELLRASTAVRGSNPMEVGMPMGNLTIPRLAGGATAAYQDELDDIAVSQERFDDVNFVAKKLTAMVPVSNDLIRRAPVGVEEIVRDDLVQTIARREDLAFLRGDGSDKGPIGMRSLVLPANLILIAAMPATPAPGDQVTAILDGASTAILALQNGMSRMIRPTWIMAPTTARFIATARDQVGNWYWKAEIESGNFEGYPFKLTQQIPTNLVNGTNTKGSEIYFVDMADFVIADTYNVIVDASDVAAYNDGTSMVSAFQRDQSIFRVIAEHDVNMRHLQSLVVLQTQDWGFAGLPGSAGAPYSTQPLNPTWSQAGAIRPALSTGAEAPPTLTDPT